jgi:hypothetical protein
LRKVPEKRLVTISLDDIEGLEGCSLTIIANPPLRAFGALESESPTALAHFLLSVLESWDGFEMPLCAESIKELNLDEIQEIFYRVRDGIKNPQRPTSTVTP